MSGTTGTRRASSRLGLLGFVPLLAVAMAAGSCGREPLDSVDAAPLCPYMGRTYQQGARFPSTDGCNVCTCDADGFARCTVKSCSDAGMRNCPDPITGELGPCPDAGPSYDVGGYDDAGEDGIICQDSSGATIPCAGDGGVGTCTYLGKIYRPGDTFETADLCNSCLCSAMGRIECTSSKCVDGGGSEDAGANPGVCQPGLDWMCNEDPSSSALRGTCQPDGSCLCNGSGTSGRVSPYTGKCLGVDNLTGDNCELEQTYPVGSTFPCGDGSCTVCMCASPGNVTVIRSGCPEASARRPP